MRFEPDEIRTRIPKEMHRRFILVCAAMGMTKTDGIQYAIARLVNDPGSVAMVDQFLQYKAEVYGVSKVEAVNAVFGAFKSIARLKRARITGVDVEPVDDRLDSVIDDAEVVDSMQAETDDFGFADDGRSQRRQDADTDE